MEEPPTKLPKNPLKLAFKIYASHSNNGMSFWALLVCVFLYISIFYLFNLSPWVLFSTSQFWFLISNTLILIIAADFGAFSSSKPNTPDPIDQLTTTPHYNFRAIENIGLVEDNETLKTPPKATSDDHVKTCQRSKSERVIQVVGDGDEDGKIGLRRSSTEKYDKPENVDEEMSDQFSGMSDEELNRRVEEFIRRFYNQQLMRPQRG